MNAKAHNLATLTYYQNIYVLGHLPCLCQDVKKKIERQKSSIREAKENKEAPKKKETETIFD